MPTVFATTKNEFKERFARLVNNFEYIHIDFMDGKFVKAKSVDLGDVPDLHGYHAFFEAHLMVERPEKMIFYLKEKGFSKVLFHYESYRNSKSVQNLIDMIKDEGMEAWIVFNPHTSLEEIEKTLLDVDRFNGIMLMGHNPGMERQYIDLHIFRRIQTLKRMSKKFLIQVDGGVNGSTISALVNSGADILNSGSFISDAKNSREAYRILKNELNYKE